MPYEQRLIDRYRGVHALAEGGSPGERDNARKIRDKMREQYPGIHEETFPPPPPPADEGFDPFRAWRTQGAAQDAGGGNPWDDLLGGRSWRDVAAEGLGWAARMAQEMSSLGTARAYVDSTVEVAAKLLQSQKLQITVKMNLRDLYSVSANMNEAQRVEFAKYVAEKVEAEMLAALNESGG
jgi:hypothetical protein